MSSPGRGQFVPQGSVGTRCPSAPNGLSSPAAPNQRCYLAQGSQVGLDAWCAAPEVFQGPLCPSWRLAGGRYQPSSPTPVSIAQILGLATCLPATYRCLNHSQIKAFFCAVQNR